MNEEWRPVVGYEGKYEVSNLGHVRSVPRTVTFTRRNASMPVTRHVNGGPLSISYNKATGYAIVGLRSGKAAAERNPENHTVHSLVAAAFIGPRPPGQDVRHLDGDRRNPRLENLAYGTRRENVEDMRLHGTHRSQLTHCRRGHPLPDESRSGRRRCPVCKAEYQRTSRRRKRAKQGLGMSA